MHVVTSRRVTPVRFLRALWRYRGKIEAHGQKFNAELATALHTFVQSNRPARALVRSYRIAMFVLLSIAVLIVLAAVALGIVLWRNEPASAMFALLLLVPGLALAWLRFTWGAPLDWYREHHDPTRTLTVAELPGRLRELAAQMHDVTDIPASISTELDVLAGVAQGQDTDTTAR